LEFDPEFWRMIQERRKETEYVSLEDFKEDDLHRG
jgi:hypothetical protein